MFWGSAGFLLGAVLGSFIKVLADRSLSRQSFWGRSYCLSCEKGLRWYDLFPILSYLLLKGKCRYCRNKIKLEYLLVEVVVGILIGYLFWQSFQNIQSFDFQFLIFISGLLLKTFFISVLVTLFITDLKEMFIPDRIILKALVIGLISLMALTVLKIGYLYYFLSQNEVWRYLLSPYSDYFFRHSLLSAQPLLGGIMMALIIGGFFYGLIVITKGKGMGGGDVKLGAFIGLMLGFPQSLVAIILAFLTGAIFSVGLIVIRKKHFGQSIPFGPFLVLGSLITLYFGQNVLDWYLSFSFKIGT